jgi:hypothetical protein
MATKDEMLLAKDWPLGRVRESLNNYDKAGLVSFLRQRYEERFLAPVRLLQTANDNWWGFGFAILALCSLLVETIQSFWLGLPSTHGVELRDLSSYNPPKEYEIPRSDWPPRIEAVFTSFFSNPLFINFFPGVDGTEFYKNIRNGLLHQAQTKHGWRITKSGTEVWNGNAKTIHRDHFAVSVGRALEAYLEKLEAEDWTSECWLKARRKIWWLMELS